MKGFLDNINYRELKDFDVVVAARPLFKQGWRIDMVSGKITMRGMEGMQQSPPWIYTNPDDKKTCAVSRAIFEMCRFVPNECMGCWKVVVKMDRVVDLFELLNWQLEYAKGYKTDRFCKCGIELREYVSYRYGGYFYNKSKTEGLKRLKVVRKAMKEINPDMDVKKNVILKRYCTEFENALGPSKLYKRPPLADKLESIVLPWIEPPKKNPKQPGYLKKHIMKEWIEFAHSRGDMSYIKLNDGEKLYPDLDTYEGGTE